MYFITICTKNRKKILSKIVSQNNVGAGLASAHYEKNIASAHYEKNIMSAHQRTTSCDVYLTNLGKIVHNEIIHLQNQFNIKINEYVIMPDHLHMIIQFYDSKTVLPKRADARPDPTLGDVICALKSKTAMEYLKYNKENNVYNKKLWQRNYYEHIIRNENEYFRICKYIKDNPMNYVKNKFDI